MAGQVAYHLLAQAGAARAPWSVTTLVSCLPVLVLAMGTALAHMLRADARIAADGPDHGTGGPADPRQVRRGPGGTGPGPGRRPGRSSGPVPQPGPEQSPRRPPRHRRRDQDTDCAETDLARLIASRLTAAGKRVSRRALRSEGIKGSNQALNALAARINAELADAAALPASPDDAAA